ITTVASSPGFSTLPGLEKPERLSPARGGLVVLQPWRAAGGPVAVVVAGGGAGLGAPPAAGGGGGSPVEPPQPAAGAHSRPPARAAAAGRNTYSTSSRRAEVIVTGSLGGPSPRPNASIALIVASDSASAACPRIPYSGGSCSPDRPEITKNWEPDAPGGAV